jgi:hypothetical protein
MKKEVADSTHKITVQKRANVIITSFVDEKRTQILIVIAFNFLYMNTTHITWCCWCGTFHKCANVHNETGRMIK